MIIKDYSEAKKIFLHYNGSYFHMQREEYLDQYMKFNIDKTISAFEKDLKYLDIFSINMILEMIHDNKKIWKNFKKKLKKIIQNNDISKNEIISKEQNKLKGTQFLTEDKVIKKYREILSKLQS